MIQRQISGGALAVLLAGCGSGGGGAVSLDGGPTAFPTSVASGKRLNELGAAEMSTLCDDARGFWDARLASADYRAANCQLAADVAALDANLATQDDLRARCTSERDACVANPSSASGTLNCGNFRSTCAVTVAAYTACMSASFDAIERFFGSAPPCDQLTFASMVLDSALNPNVNPPAACATFDSECLIADGGADGDSRP